MTSTKHQRRVVSARQPRRKDLPPESGKPPVVALGGSAGSLDFITQFLSVMPPDCGLAFIVVLHLSPDHKSNLPGILQRRCRLRVMHPTHEQKIEANCVYVIPPERSLEVAGDRLQLENLPSQVGIRAAVDVLFTSLATHCGHRAAAIVYSGADSDGAAGLKCIKLAGGFTLVQDLAEARHREMPRAALGTGCVDAVLTAAEMPARILEHFGHGSAVALPTPLGLATVDRRTIGQEEDEFISEALRCVRTHTGQDFNYYRRLVVLRRLERRMQIAQADKPRDYLNILSADRGESEALRRDLLISVTSFFRDPDSFRALTRFVPELFKGKGPNDFVRVWVPGCATGEEVYSVAMLLLDHVRGLDNAPGVQVFGCDLDAAAIDIARSGLYPDRIAASVSEDRLRRFFIKESKGFRVRRELRQSVLFALHDVVKDPAFARMDLITCRNLLIYLHADAQKRMFDVFHFALRERGLLFLGSSEGIQGESPRFETLDREHCLYRRKAGKTSITGQAFNAGALLQALKRERRALGLPAAKPLTLARAAVDTFASEDTSSLAELHLRMIERLAPASVVVDEEYRIVHLSGKMGPFLKFAGVMSVELPRLVHPSLLVRLRSALSRAAESAAPITIPNVSFEMDGRACEVNITATPAGDLAPGYLLVTFDVLQSEKKRRAEDHRRSAAQQLEQELELVRARLEETAKRSELHSGELEASNQELYAINQELRSTTEELEINRQELQSINEELSAVNQELSINLDDLARANSDLHNLMNATAIPTVFLDEQLQIKRYTPTADELFNLIPTDVGRQLAHLRHRLDYPGLLDDARRVLASSERVHIEVRDHAGRWFLARVLPYRSPDREDGNTGIVLTFFDISERKRAEEALRERAAWLAGQREALEAAVNGAPLATSLGVIVRTAVTGLGEQARAAVYLANDEGTSLHHVVGMSPEYAQAVNGFAIGPESLACGLATHCWQPVLTSDVQTDPRWEPWRWLAEKFGYRTCWSFPIHTSAGKFVGTLAVYFPQPRDVTERDQQLASLLIGTASIIISRHQESEARREAEAALASELDAMTRLRALSDRLLSTTDLSAALGEVLDCAIALHTADFGTAQVYDAANDVLQYAAARGFDEAALLAIPPIDRDFHSTCAAVIRTGDQVIVTDMVADARFADHVPTAASLGYRAAFSFPLKTRRGEFQGVLTVHFRAPRCPADREMRWAALYAPLAAHLIERYRTETALRESEARLRALIEEAPLA